ncbi:MAG: YbfB/YjiJ family MFS transporter, partial [Comamonas sp.]
MTVQNPAAAAALTDSPAAVAGAAAHSSTPTAVHAAAPMAPPSALAVALLGTLALCLAMGLGRFAFTPLLPLMLRDGSITLAEGGWLAAANYLGYFVGAAACAGLPAVWRRCTGREAPAGRLAWGGLVATWLLLLAMAVPWPALWPWARFLAGVASALTFVFTSAWCMPRLALRGGGHLAGLVYTGPGVGIV